jgi:hypothetical protein
MGFWENLKRRLSPPRMLDPDFGPLLFMYIPNAPERSYWEADDWLFRPTQTRIGIALPGPKEGPLQEGRQFYLQLVDRFDNIMEHVRPELDRVAREWLGRPLATDLWADFKLAGFDVEEPSANLVEWTVSFEATGETWLGVTIPFLDNDVRPAVVDT